MEEKKSTTLKTKAPPKACAQEKPNKDIKRLLEKYAKLIEQSDKKGDKAESEKYRNKLRTFCGHYRIISRLMYRPERKQSTLRNSISVIKKKFEEESNKYQNTISQWTETLQNDFEKQEAALYVRAINNTQKDTTKIEICDAEDIMFTDSTECPRDCTKEGLKDNNQYDNKEVLKISLPKHNLLKPLSSPINPYLSNPITLEDVETAFSNFSVEINKLAQEATEQVVEQTISAHDSYQKACTEIEQGKCAKEIEQYMNKSSSQSSIPKTLLNKLLNKKEKDLQLAADEYGRRKIDSFNKIQSDFSSQLDVLYSDIHGLVAAKMACEAELSPKRKCFDAPLQSKLFGVSPCNSKAAVFHFRSPRAFIAHN